MILSCPFCSARPEPEAKVCASCGKTMSRACPHCSEEIAVNAPLCKYCGGEAPASPAPAGPPAAPPEIEFLDAAPRPAGRRGGTGAFLVLLFLALAGVAAFFAVSRVRCTVHRGRPAEIRSVEEVKGAPLPAPAPRQY